MPFLARFALSWAIDALALALAAWIFSGVSVGGSAGTLVLAALVFGLLSSFLKPLLKVLTFPLALLTLGVSWFFVAMFVLWLTDAIVGAFRIDGFWTLAGATVIVWAVGALAGHWLFPARHGRRRRLAGAVRGLG